MYKLRVGDVAVGLLSAARSLLRNPGDVTRLPPDLIDQTAGEWPISTIAVLARAAAGLCLGSFSDERTSLAKVRGKLQLEIQAQIQAESQAKAGRTPPVAVDSGAAQPDKQKIAHATAATARYAPPHASPSPPPPVGPQMCMVSSN